MLWLTSALLTRNGGPAGFHIPFLLTWGIQHESNINQFHNTYRNSFCILSCHLELQMLFWTTTSMLHERAQWEREMYSTDIVSNWVTAKDPLQRNSENVPPLTGTLPLFELGFMTKLLRWCNNATIFCYAHAVLNVLPMQILDLVRMCLGRIFSIFGMRLSKQFSTTVRILASCSTLPMQYHPFSSPSTPWRFRSTVKLPEDWDLFEYLLICCRAGYAFAIDRLKGPSRNYPREFCDMRIFSHETAVSDALSAFAHPQASFFYSVAAFVVRLGLSWMSLSVTVANHLFRSFIYSFHWKGRWMEMESWPHN